MPPAPDIVKANGETLQQKYQREAKEGLVKKKGRKGKRKTYSGNRNSTKLGPGVLMKRLRSWPACSTMRVCRAFISIHVSCLVMYECIRRVIGFVPDSSREKL